MSPSLEPVKRKANVRDFFSSDALLHESASFISGLAKARRKICRVIEVGSFESDSHKRTKLFGLFAGWDALPKPIPHRKVD